MHEMHDKGGENDGVNGSATAAAIKATIKATLAVKVAGWWITTIAGRSNKVQSESVAHE